MPCCRNGLLLIIALSSNALGADGNVPSISSPLELWEGAVPLPLLLSRCDVARPRIGTRLPPQVVGSVLHLVERRSELTVDPVASQVEVESRLEVEAVSGSTTAIYFYLPPFESAVPEFRDEVGPLPSAVVSKDVFGVAPRIPLRAGNRVILYVRIQGKPNCTGTSTPLGARDCELSPSHVLTRYGWDLQLIDGTNPQLVAPDTSRALVTVPGTWDVAAGALPERSRDNANGTRTFEFIGWSDRAPFTFNAGPRMAQISDWDGSRTVGSHLSSAHLPRAAAFRAQAIRLMTAHEAHFGPYSRGKLDLAEISDGIAFAADSVIFLQSAVYQQDPENLFVESLMGHELGHQWFGLQIQVEDYHFAPWLSEGGASWAQIAYTLPNIQARRGIDFGPSLRVSLAQEYLYRTLGAQEVPIASKDIFKTPSSLYTALTYRKGTAVFVMLAQLLGEAGFQAALNRYRQDHTQKLATVDSFRASLEAASGSELKPFFDRWVFDTGYPTYRIEVHRGIEPGATQVTVRADRDFAVPFELELVTSDGRRALQTVGAGVMERTFAIDSGEELIQVRGDPEHRLFGRVRGALEGDVYLNGEVDGVDLIYVARSIGQTFKPSSFPYPTVEPWADLVFDGKVDELDLAAVRDAFGTTAPEAQ